jgi:diaminopropionate ammonia-lyase
MKLLKNPYRGQGLPSGATNVEGTLVDDPTAAQALLALCPIADVTPLSSAPTIAQSLGIKDIFIKDERARMGLGSFKALGAAHAIAKQAWQKLGDDLADPARTKTALSDAVFCAATAGNHGLSIAAGARVFGARAVIYIAETVPASFEARLKSLGAEVIREGQDYEASLDGAKAAAAENHWQLLSDTSWPGYTDPPRDVMEGYLIMAAEAADQWPEDPPSHIFLPAGVGGLAGAAAIYARKRWGDAPLIVVVEPEAAPALHASIAAGHPVVTAGPVSNMGRLDCKEPSHLALKSLAETADYFMTLSDQAVTDAIADLDGVGFATSPSGGAGYAGILAAVGLDELRLAPDSRVLLYLSEGP